MVITLHKKTYEGIMHLLSRGYINNVLLMNKVKIDSLSQSYQSALRI